MSPDRLAAAALAIGGHRTLGTVDVVAQLAAIGGHFALRTGALAQAYDYAHAVLARLPAAGLPATSPSRFDLTEVVNLLALGEAGRGRPAMPAGGVETGRCLVAALAGQTGTAAAPALALLAPRRFTVTFARTFDLAHVTPGASRRLRLPLPVEDAQLGALAVGVDGGARLRPGRIEWRPLSGDCGRVTLAAEFRFVSRPASPSAMMEDVTPWLAEAEGVIRVTPRVRALAARLAEAAPDALAVIHAFRDHLLDAFGCGIVHYDRIGARPATDWVLDHGWFDCRLGAAMLAALCRARGIPARLVGGYLLWDAPAEHYWMEAWLPGRGWLPFDLMAWGLSAGGADAGWRPVYAGAIDYRMKTQVFPYVVTGAPGVPLAGPIYRLTRPIDGGAESRFVSANDGRLLYADAIRIVTG